MIKKLLILMFSFSTIAFGAETATEKLTTEQENQKKEGLKEAISETTHTAKINGKEITYKAIAGTLPQTDDKGTLKATIFYVAYLKEGENNPSERPITFCFNGGPGSSSVWLHMGVLGPKRVELNDLVFTPPPYHFMDNEYSILDLTDLVFIDPVSTGYSRAAHGEDLKQFHGVTEDVESVAKFIRLYTTRAERWDSPKYLAGESYGTTRAAALAEELHDKHYYDLNGIILLSSVLNFQTINDGTGGNDLPYLLFLPSYTATAWYHKKLAPELLRQSLLQTLEESKQFAYSTYALALMKGDQISSKEREMVIQNLAKYTGLSPQYIDQSNLRISMDHFSKELLRHQGQIVGRFDGRFLGMDLNLVGEAMRYDPSADAIFGAFAAVLNQYLRTELKWKEDREYKILTNVFPWNYGHSSNESLNVAGKLKDLMIVNPNLKIFVGSGYYDLATPFAGIEYTFSRLYLPPIVKKNLTFAYYDAGHMMYIHPPSLIKVKKDLKEWMNKR